MTLSDLSRRQVLSSLPTSFVSFSLGGKILTAETEVDNSLIDPYWSVNTGRRVDFGIIIGDDSLYLLERHSGAHTVVSRHLQTGKAQWTRRLRNQASSPMDLDFDIEGESIIILDGSQSTLSVFDRKTGQDQWRFEFDSAEPHPELTVEANNNFVVVSDEKEGLTQNRLTVIDLTSGEAIVDKRIPLSAPQKDVSVPSASYLMFTTTDKHRIVNIDSRTGKIQQEYEISHSIASDIEYVRANLEIDNGRFWISTAGTTNAKDRVYEDLSDTPIFETEGDIVGVSGNSVYVVQDSLKRIHLPTGQTDWDISVQPASDISIEEENIYIVTQAETGFRDGDLQVLKPGKVRVVDSITGNLNWSRQLFENLEEENIDRFSVETTLPDDNLYVSNAGKGTLVAFDPETGNLLDWEIELPDAATDYIYLPRETSNDVVIAGANYDMSSETKSLVSVFPTLGATDTGNDDSGESTVPAVADQYDENGNGQIDLDEVRAGINDFAAGDLSVDEVRTLINIWANDTPV